LGCPFSNSIYHSTQFGVIWRLPSAMPNYWALTIIQEGPAPLEDSTFRGYLLEFRSETSRGDSTHLIYSLEPSSECFEALSSRVELLRVFSLPARPDLASLGVWYFIRPRSLLVLVFMVYSTFGGLHPLTERIL
jgi:hypothetical protein